MLIWSKIFLYLRKTLQDSFSNDYHGNANSLKKIINIFKSFWFMKRNCTPVWIQGLSNSYSLWFGNLSTAHNFFHWYRISKVDNQPSAIIQCHCNLCKVIPPNSTPCPIFPDLSEHVPEKLSAFSPLYIWQKNWIKKWL